MSYYFEDLYEKMKNIWHEMPVTYDSYVGRYQRHKDKSLRSLNKSIKKNLRQLITGKESIDHIIEEQLMTDIRTFAIKTLGMSSFAVDRIFRDEYFKHSQEFIKRAKELLPDIDGESLFQALRNVWTMHSMQTYLNKAVELTDSVFAYSMLYPLTDNYLDDPNVSYEKKSEFNRRFRSKIQTGEGLAQSENEGRIFHMIDLIESEWPRDQYPKVYESLMAILDGQQLSLKQQNHSSLSDLDLLFITFYKGGASVLADAYLIAGQLNASQEDFAFMYGVILQLADDLQDIKADLSEKHMTMMNTQVQVGYLDELINKYLNMINVFFKEYYTLETKGQKALNELTFESIQLLIFEASMKSKKYISKEMYEKVKVGSHFSPKAYQVVEKDFNKQLRMVLGLS
jgi:hypothetical protein